MGRQAAGRAFRPARVLMCAYRYVCTCACMCMVAEGGKGLGQGVCAWHKRGALGRQGGTGGGQPLTVVGMHRTDSVACGMLQGWKGEGAARGPGLLHGSAGGCVRAARWRRNTHECVVL